MDHRTKVARALVTALVIALVAVACAPQAAPQPGAGQATASPAAKAGGRVTVALWQEPEGLNPYINIQTVARVVGSVIHDGLIAVDPQGRFVPDLASAVPSVQNGGVSADGKVVTYKLASGLKWADGKPLTSSDVKFTFDAIMNKDNPVKSREGYEQIASVETPDAATVRVTFKEFYSPFLTLFPFVLPAHLAGAGSTRFDGEAYLRKPLGAGAFTVQEWRSGELLALKKNPNYRLAGKPGLDEVVIRFTPSREVSIAQLKSGDADAVWNLIESSIPDLEKAPSIKLQLMDSANLEYLGLNMSDAADATKPHPILGDPAVRKGLGLAVNKTEIVDKLLFGKAKVATSPIPLGWAADTTLQPVPFNTEEAKRLLESAGWKPGADGIRAKDGRRLSLKITTTTGDKLREQVQQVLQQQLKAVGAELVIDNVPSQVLFGGLDKQGPLKTGKFDIVMDTWGPDIDPNEFVTILFHSSSIPTAENKGEGWNFYRMRVPELDRAIEEGRQTPDLEKRKAAYARVQRAIIDTGAYVPLYKRLLINGFQTKVEGWKDNPWMPFLWDIADWTVR